MFEDVKTENMEEVVELQQPITTPLEEELAHAKDQWLRAVAELENLRRRAQKEREEALKYASTAFAKRMLDVADNVQRALLASPAFYEKVEPLADKDFFVSFVQGMEMISKAFATALESQGITAVEALHQTFDPNVHQALMEIESSDHKPGTVVQVIQDGYKIHDRLLRPALVGVSKAAATSPEPSSMSDGHIKVTLDV